MAASDVSIKCAGNIYRGSYQLAGDILHVASPYGSGSARLGALQGPPEALAKILLYGLSQAWERRVRHVGEAMSA